MPNSEPSLTVKPQSRDGVDASDSPIDSPPAPDTAQSEWAAEHELNWHRAETERLKVLVDFLSNPVHAHGGSEPDPDIITAYNLAVEAALKGIRRASLRGI